MFTDITVVNTDTQWVQYKTFILRLNLYSDSGEQVLEVWWRRLGSGLSTEHFSRFRRHSRRRWCCVCRACTEPPWQRESLLFQRYLWRGCVKVFTLCHKSKPFVSQKCVLWLFSYNFVHPLVIHSWKFEAPVFMWILPFFATSHFLISFNSLVEILLSKSLSWFYLNFNFLGICFLNLMILDSLICFNWYLVNL